MIFYRTLESSPVHSCYSSSQRMKSSVFFWFGLKQRIIMFITKSLDGVPFIEPFIRTEHSWLGDHWFSWKLRNCLQLGFFLFPSFQVIFGKRHIFHKHFFVKLCKKTDDPILIKWWWDVDGNFVSCNKKIIKAFLCFSCRDVRVMGLPQWSSLCNDRSQCQFFPANFQNKIILKDAIPSFLFSSSLQHKFSNFHGYFSNFQLVNASSVCLQFLYC